MPNCGLEQYKHTWCSFSLKSPSCCSSWPAWPPWKAELPKNFATSLLMSFPGYSWVCWPAPLHTSTLSSLQLWFPFLHIAEKKTVSKHPTVPRQLAFPPGLLRASLSEPIHHLLYGREEGCSGASLRYSNTDLQIGRVIHHPGQPGCNSEIKSGATGQESRPSADDLFLPAFCWGVSRWVGELLCGVAGLNVHWEKLPLSPPRGNRVNVPFKGKFGW